MKTDIQKSHSWEAFNNQIREQWEGISPDVDVQTYQGVHHALQEITRGLVQLFPHKTNVAYVPGTGPYFAPVVLDLSRDGLDVQKLNPEETPDQCFGALKPSTLCVMSASDDPLTGEIFGAWELGGLCNSKQVFSITLSHSYHLCRGLKLPVGDFSIHLYSLAPDLCVALLGKRVKFRPPIASGLVWSARPLPLNRQAESEALVRRFEQQWAGEAAFLYFSETKPRLFDRAVVCWRDMDGSAFVELLAKEMALPNEPGKYLETASLCRWEKQKTIDWLSIRGLAPELIRGLVVFSVELIKPGLVEKTKAVRQQIKQLQDGPNP